MKKLYLLLGLLLTSTAHCAYISQPGFGVVNTTVLNDTNAVGAVTNTDGSIVITNLITASFTGKVASVQATVQGATNNNALIPQLAGGGVLTNQIGHIWYVMQWGTNGASGTYSDPFANPTNAFAVHNTNDIIAIGNGTFDVGTNLGLMAASNNVTIAGWGHNQTFITFEGTGETSVVQVMAAPKSGGTLKGFTLVCTNFNLTDVLLNPAGNTEITPLQFGNLGFYQDVYVYGVSDCLLNNTAGGGFTNTFLDCHFESQWDTYESNQGGNYLECFNTWWVNTNSFYTNAVLERGIALLGRNNTVKLHGGGMLFTNNSAANIVLGIESAWTATGASTNNFDLDHISMTFKNPQSASNAFAAYITGTKATGQETWILRYVDGFSVTNGGTHSVIISNADPVALGTFAFPGGSNLLQLIFGYYSTNHAYITSTALGTITISGGSGPQ